MVSYAGTFDSAEKAEETSQALQSEGLRATDILVLTGTIEPKVLDQAQRRNFMSGSLRERVVQEASNGKHVVVVRAPLGTGLATEGVFAAQEATMLPPQVDSVERRHLSEMGGAPMLYKLKPNADVFRKYFSAAFPLIISTKGGRTGGWGGLPLLSKGHWSSAFPLQAKGFMSGMMPLLWRKRKS